MTASTDAIGDSHHQKGDEMGTGLDGAHAERVRKLLRAHVAPAGPLHHLARFADGVAEPTFDELAGILGDEESPAAQALRSAGLDAESTKSILLLLDHRMASATTELDRMLQPAHSGDLIRVVAQTETGACYCLPIVPGAFLVGALITGGPGQPGTHPRGFPAVDAGDKAISAAVAQLRRLISLRPLNFGGFEDGDAMPPVRRPAHQVRVCGNADHPLSPLLRAALSPDDLHYVGLVERGTLRVAMDIFDDEALGPFFDLVHVAARRRFHDGFAPTLGAIAAELSRIVWPLLAARLNRLVLDVEQGAVYFVRVSDETYLAGVTLDQARVSHADDEIDRLAAAFTTARRHRDQNPDRVRE